MPSSKTKTSRRGTRKASGAPAQNAVRRKKQTARRKQRASGKTKPKAAAAPRPKKTTPRAKTARLPGWKELTTRNERTASRPRTATRIDQVSTVRFGLLLLVLAAGITLYVGHVQATQDLLAEVQQTRRENLRLHLKMNRLQGEFEQATGPEVVYRRARALGLVEGIDYGPTIRTSDDER